MRSSFSFFSSFPSSSLESSETRSVKRTLGSQFQTTSKKDKFRYSLPTHIGEYANTNFESYVKEADIKQQILMKNPVPDNLDQVRKLDDFVRDILKDKYK